VDVDRPDAGGRDVASASSVRDHLIGYLNLGETA
jgi:hypothetical protein